MTQYTPGPWRAEKNATGSFTVLAPNHYVDDDLSEFVAFGVSKADARLIATAPELLEAIRDLAERRGHPGDRLDRALAAIAKAEAC